MPYLHGVIHMIIKSTMKSAGGWDQIMMFREDRSRTRLRDPAITPG
jgi:hypothetical protein